MIGYNLPTPVAVYPADFPQPLRANYSGAIEYPVVSTPMQSGHAKRRLLHPYKLWSVQMSFMMRATAFYNWHQWVHAYGYYWFSMDVQDDQVDDPNRLLTTAAALRFTGGASWQHNDWGDVVVNIQAEAAIRRSAR